MTEYCAIKECLCHTGGEDKRVRTPFPVGLGPQFCCNKCARIGTREEIYAALEAAQQMSVLDA